jgi:hypothetical protein
MSTEQDPQMQQPPPELKTRPLGLQQRVSSKVGIGIIVTGLIFLLIIVLAATMFR